MNSEQRAAFINAQAACLMAEVAGMVAENDYRKMRGESVAYTEDAFQAAINNSPCAYNSAIEFLREY